MTDVGITEQLAGFSADLSFGELPEAVTARVKQLVLDLLGVAVRARFDVESTPPMLRAIAALRWDRGDCTIIGNSGGYAPAAAALANGALAHSLDFDDTHAAGSLHPSAPIVPAAFAAAELAGANGADVIAGIVAGYEVQTRLSLALVPSRHYSQGFHPTATCGTFGAAAAAGRVLGLSAQQLQSAFGLCGSMAAGSMQFLADGAWNKRFHTGYAAMNGLVAAVTAGQDYRGAGASIEGPAGFLHGYSPSPEPARAVEALGKRFLTLEIAVKPYPCCRYSHAALDAIIALRAENRIEPRRVRSIDVGLPLTGQRIIGEPAAAKQRPKNVVDGQFSMAFVAAVALREGRMSWDDYGRHLIDPETLELCERVSTHPDPMAEAEFPQNMSARVRIETADGSCEKFVRVPKGEPDNFMTDAELAEKFRSLCAPYLAAAELDATRAALASFEQVHDICSVLARLAPAR